MNNLSRPSVAPQVPAIDTDSSLEKLLLRKWEINNKYREALATRTQFALMGLFLSILAPILTVSLARSTGSEFAFLNSLYGRELTFFEVTLTIFSYYAFAILLVWLYFHYAVGRLKRELLGLDSEIEEAYLLAPGMRLKYFQKQFLQLASKSIRIKWIDTKSRQPSEDLRSRVGDMLAKLEEKQAGGRPQKTVPGEMVPEWDDVQTALAQWDELLQDEQRDLDDQKNWKIGSIGIALLYLVLLIAATRIFNTAKDVFGVPFPIIIWSAVGSFAAILYRFYKSPRRINLEIEIRWLFARPLIGIVMGVLAYLALVAGLFIFGGSQADTSPDASQAKGVLIQFWIVAFLAGFSDKFYETVIELLVGKFGVGSGNEVDSYVEKTESKVEVVTEKKE